MDYIRNLHHKVCSIGEPLVKDWPLVKSPVIPAIILTLYLALIYIGMKVMKHRRAYVLKKSLLVYNAFIILLTAYTTFGLLRGLFALPDLLYQHHRRRLISKIGPGFDIMKFHYLYYLLKIVELADTAFFVFRKKFNQVTFLHIYHHASIFLIQWHQFKFYPGSLVMIGGTVNSTVHIFMYSYYMLAALGPQVQKYLWWKRYITQMQLVQFAIMLVYLVYIYLTTTLFSRPLILVYLLYNFSLVALFLHFYSQSYKFRNKAE